MVAAAAAAVPQLHLLGIRLPTAPKVNHRFGPFSLSYFFIQTNRLFFTVDNIHNRHMDIDGNPIDSEKYCGKRVASYIGLFLFFGTVRQGVE